MLDRAPIAINSIMSHSKTGYDHYGASGNHLVTKVYIVDILRSALSNTLLTHSSPYLL